METKSSHPHTNQCECKYEGGINQRDIYIYSVSLVDLQTLYLVMQINDIHLANNPVTAIVGFETV